MLKKSMILMVGTCLFFGKNFGMVPNLTRNSFTYGELNGELNGSYLTDLHNMSQLLVSKNFKEMQLKETDTSLNKHERSLFRSYTGKINWMDLKEETFVIWKEKVKELNIKDEFENAIPLITNDLEATKRVVYPKRWVARILLSSAILSFIYGGYKEEHGDDRGLFRGLLGCVGAGSCWFMLNYFTEKYEGRMARLGQALENNNKIVKALNQ